MSIIAHWQPNREMERFAGAFGERKSDLCPCVTGRHDRQATASSRAPFAPVSPPNPCALGTPLAVAPGEATTDQLPPHSRAPFSPVSTHNPCALGTPLALRQGKPRLTSYQAACAAIRCYLDTINFSFDGNQRAEFAFSFFPNAFIDRRRLEKFIRCI